MIKKIFFPTIGFLLFVGYFSATLNQALAFSLVSGSEADLCSAPTYSDQINIVGRFKINYVLLPGRQKYEFKPDPSEYQNLPLTSGQSAQINQGLNKILALKISDLAAAKLPTDRAIKISVINYKAFCEGLPQVDFLNYDSNFTNIQGSFKLISGKPDDICTSPTFLGEEMITGQFAQDEAIAANTQATAPAYKFIVDDDQRGRLPMSSMQSTDPSFNKEVSILNADQIQSIITRNLTNPISVIVDKYAAYCKDRPAIRIKTNFTDVPAKNTFSDEIDLLKTLDIISGYSDGTFRPDRYINRAEFTKIVLTTIFSEDDLLPAESCFSDVNKDAWYAKYVCTAKTADIIGGYTDGTFKPNQTITLAEALKIVLKINGIIYKEAANWYDGVMAKASEQNIVTFAPATFDQKLTRSQMADIIAETIRQQQAK